MARPLSALKTKDLRRLAFLLGSPLESTKSALQTTLKDRLRFPLIDEAAPRILSVDMGIRNLAYCVINLEKSLDQVTVESSEHKVDLPGQLNVTHWQKLDLLSQIRQASPARSPIDAGASSESFDGLDNNASSNLFTPPTISEIACNFTEVILSHEPAIILIERQRFRSGGGSAIQEWTIRVNMLESMLWACLATMKRQHRTKFAFPVVHSVEPARVARFWHQMQSLPVEVALQAESESTNDIVASSRTTKITKALRMALLRKWIQDQSEGLSPLKFTGQAEHTVQAFTGSRNKDKADNSPGKLDDLTDCLMQGAAWVRWETNRRTISSIVDLHE